MKMMIMMMRALGLTEYYKLSVICILLNRIIGKEGCVCLLIELPRRDMYGETISGKKSSGHNCLISPLREFVFGNFLPYTLLN